MKITFASAWTALAVSFGALTIISGCMVGPDYKPPKTEAPPAWSEVTNVSAAAETRLTSNAVDMAQWWTRFHDPKLIGLVQAALATNLDVQLAEALLREARAVRGKDAGGLWPSVTVSGSVTRSGTVNGVSYDAAVNELGAGALWNLDFFGVTRRQVESDDAGIQAAQENLYGAQVTLASEVALDYIQVRSAQEQIAIAQTNLQSELHTAEVTREKAAAGFVSALDQANAEAEVATTAATIPPLEITIRQNIFALSILLDRPPAALLEDLSKPGAVPLAPPEVPVGLPSDLLRRRPDIRAAEANLHAAAALIGVAVADFYPQFSLTGTLNYESTSTRDMFAGPNGIWSAGPQVSWPIFSGGSIISNLRLQKAATDAAYITYQKTVLAAFADVESYLVAFTKEWDHRKALSDAVVLNRRALVLSQQLYQAGTEEFLTVLDAERSLLASETALAQSRQAISSDLVNIYRALGGGWE
ncbi:MAG TPA: efflux transporter outer membrane subunit [Candidatus Baltobacteraceae bacterium]|jgi:NodT family efflux transporter outer membrane factor (OMF) lipoprotein|nr:efflux transporter outer membrane subunit [Candidatus Baltobacteraceae bacterium]